MAENQTKKSAGKVNILTMDQVSAGGVAFRWNGPEPEAVIVSVKPSLRWQLPKGIVDRGESPEVTAQREVKEEAGVETNFLALIETIEYWYRAVKYGRPVRYHKLVHFYLLEYRSGNVSEHDHEIAESRWVGFQEAVEMLAFKSEQKVVEKAREMISKYEKGELSKRCPSTNNTPPPLICFLQISKPDAWGIGCWCRCFI